MDNSTESGAWLMDRHMCGIYFRVKRLDNWDNVCFSDLTKGQMKKVLENKSNEFLIDLAISLGKTLYKVGHNCDLYGE